MQKLETRETATSMSEDEKRQDPNWCNLCFIIHRPMGSSERGDR